MHILIGYKKKWNNIRFRTIVLKEKARSWSFEGKINSFKIHSDFIVISNDFLISNIRMILILIFLIIWKWFIFYLKINNAILTLY